MGNAFKNILVVLIICNLSSILLFTPKLVSSVLTNIIYSLTSHTIHNTSVQVIGCCIVLFPGSSLMNCFCLPIEYWP